MQRAVVPVIEHVGLPPHLREPGRRHVGTHGHVVGQQDACPAHRRGHIDFLDKLPARIMAEARKVSGGVIFARTNIEAIERAVALRLQREPDSKAVVVGYHDPKERAGDRLAQERASNTKAYLTQEKGIDPSRIEVRTNTTETGQKADVYLVPSGATFNEQGAQTFTERAPTPARRTPARRTGGTGAARRPAAKKPAATPPSQ